MNSANNSPNQAAAANPPPEDPSIVSGAEDEPNGDATKNDANNVVEDNKGMGQKNFAEKLFLLLEMDEYQDIFYWLPDGEAFCVADQVAFESRIMSKHFPSAKFQRCAFRCVYYLDSYYSMPFLYLTLNHSMCSHSSPPLAASPAACAAGASIESRPLSSELLASSSLRVRDSSEAASICASACAITVNSRARRRCLFKRKEEPVGWPV